MALGKPLLSSEKDQELVLQALGKVFPQDLKKTAVVLVGHGSPSPQGEQAYLALEKLLRSRYPGQNVYLGVVEGKPDRDAALAQVRRVRRLSVRSSSPFSWWPGSMWTKISWATAPRAGSPGSWPRGPLRSRGTPGPGLQR